MAAQQDLPSAAFLRNMAQLGVAGPEKGGIVTAQEQYRACVEGLNEFVQGIGATDVVIGLSGGIDSTLVACICVDALGSDHVHGYMLPGPYSTDHSLKDAHDLADNLGMKAEVISIAEPYRAFAEQLGAHCNMERGLAAENTQARCRMVTLMALSNAYGWMLVNCGNRSEAMMGYSTLYGDTAGAYAPIGGLYKTDVFAICRWLNEEARAQGRVEPIPENVILKPPSAELAPDQFDEDTLGSYDELDRILVDHVERGMDAKALVAAGYDFAEVERITKRVASYAFKRALLPPCPPFCRTAE